MLHIINPANGQLIEGLPEDTPEGIREKHAAARTAQPAWAARPLEERAQIIRAFRASLEAQQDTLARTLSSEMGKPVSQAAGEVKGTLGRIDFFLENAARSLAPEPLLDTEAGGGTAEEITHEPLGVIANISAWNYPYFVGSNVFVPALLAGNAVLYKPSEHSTLTGRAIARLLHAAGVPREVFALIVGGGAAGAALLELPLDGIFFTGSYATGRKIAEAAARQLTKVQLELGGKDPAYVTDDVNVQAAAEGLADGAFYNTGQSCCAVERIYVHEAVYDTFVDAFVETVRGFSIGDPDVEGTYIGPLAREPQLAVLEAQVKDALDKGATLKLGGKRMERAGYYFEPTVLVDVDHSMRVMSEESFGPIIGIQKVSSDEEAAQLMADTPYGLTAGVYARGSERARSILAQLRTGSSYWNCCDRVSPRLPWSGRGHSGLGLTLSTYGIQTFTHPRAWHLRQPA